MSHYSKFLLLNQDQDGSLPQFRILYKIGKGLTQAQKKRIANRILYLNEERKKLIQTFRLEVSSIPEADTTLKNVVEAYFKGKSKAIQIKKREIYRFLKKINEENLFEVLQNESTKPILTKDEYEEFRTRCWQRGYKS